MPENFIKNILPFILVVMMVFTGCSNRNLENKKSISIKGSDTMVNLTQRWAEVYMKEHKDISIQVTGGGSGTGVAALLNNTADIVNISRELKDKELEQAKKIDVVPVQHKVALDGIAVIVNPVNNINTLTIAQIRDIFSGKIKNWKQVGGNNFEIVIYGRENSSGTYEHFKQSVLGKDSLGAQIDFSTSMQVLQGTAALGESVARDKRGIGFGGVGYFAKRNDLKVIYIKKDKSSPAISPVEDGKVNYTQIWNDQYFLSRYLYCYTNGNPKENSPVKNFLDFIVSPEGQKIVEEMEYIPLKK